MRFALCTFLILASWGCGGSEQGPTMMTRPGMRELTATAPPGAVPGLVSVAPRGGSTGVAISEPIALRFGTPIAAAMEQYVDLHQGSIAGPLVPISCAFSADRTTLTCVPNGPLAPRTTYVLHVGGGMMTVS